MARSLTTQAIAFFSSASSALGGDFFKSAQSDERVFLVNTLLRELLNAMHTALTARPRAIQESAQSTFLLWQSPQPPLESRFPESRVPAHRQVV